MIDIFNDILCAVVKVALGTFRVSASYLAKCLASFSSLLSRIQEILSLLHMLTINPFTVFLKKTIGNWRLVTRKESTRNRLPLIPFYFESNTSHLTKLGKRYLKETGEMSMTLM